MLDNSRRAGLALALALAGPGARVTHAQPAERATTPQPTTPQPAAPEGARAPAPAPGSEPGASPTESRHAPPAPSEEEEGAEVIAIEERWPGVDLVDAEHTSRATAVVTPSDARAAATVSDALVGVPGVAVQRTGPGQGVPILRGLIGSAVLVVVDGIRLNNAIFRPAPNQYTSLVDPWNVETLTVLKGPGSAPFGSDALGGVIEVTTPLPAFADPRWSTRSEIAFGASSADRSAVAHASLAAGRGGLGVAAALTLENHDHLRSGDGTRQAPSAYRAGGGQLTAHWDRGRAATTAWLHLYEQPELPRTDELRPGFGQDQAAAEVWAYRPSRRVVAHVRELRRGLWGTEGVELHAAYQRIDDDRRIRDTGASDELREQITDHGLTALARVAAQAAGAALLGGAEVVHDRVSCQRVTVDITTNEQTPATCRFPDGSTMTQLGLFAEARRGFASDRLQTRLGVRGGATRLRLTGAPEARAELDFVDWAAELGLEARLADGLSAVANAGRGFRAPNINDLAGLGPRPGNRFQEPSDRLASEHGTGVDLGLRARRGGVVAEGYAFALWHQDRIDVVPTGRVTDSGREIVVSDNVGTTRTLGVELAATLAASRELMLAGALTYVYGVKDDRGEGAEPADRIPPLGGRLTALFEPAPRLVLDGEVRVAAAQRRLSARDREDPRIDPMGTPGFATFAVGARYQLGRIVIAARVENLLDRQYREHASGVDAAGIDARLLVRWSVNR